MKLAVVVNTCCLLAFVSIASASYCTGGPSPDAPPNLKLVEDVKLVEGGNHERTASLVWAHREDNSTFPVLHLYGEPGYAWGFAQGSLLRERCIKMWEAFWAYLLKQAGSEAVIRSMMEPIVANSAKYTPKYIIDEVKGLADATGYNYTRLMWIQLFPESAGGHCSMFGAWGDATIHNPRLQGETLQMRALDYITAPFLTDNHALIVYHPTKGHATLNVGFIGIVSMVTGVNAAPMALSQIGVSNPDDTFGPQRNGQGTPFTFLLRDLMMKQGSVPEVKAALSVAHRTLDLILGFGEPLSATQTRGNIEKGKPFTGVQYAADQVRFYDDTNMLPVNHSWHAPIRDVVYHGMDWDCPAWTGLLGEQIRKYHGNLTAEITMQYINPIVQTGNLHVAIYEIKDQVMYLAHGKAGDDGHNVNAFATAYMRIHAGAMLERPAPH